jgi:signal transduction histidine kinase
MIPDPSGASLRVSITHGEHADAVRGAIVPIDGTIAGEVFSSGVAQLVVDVGSEPRVFLPALGVARPGPVVYAPLAGKDRTLGVLSVDNPESGRPFESVDLQIVDDFARQAALAVELARGRTDLERLAMLEDRERIARNLHDTVIQRLFAVGMTLQAIAPGLGEGHEARRVAQAVEDIDETIREIRSSIFALEVHQRQGLRAEIFTLAQESAERAGFEPRFTFEGPIDDGIPSEVVAHLLAVVREALSNAVRHAHATIVEVHLSAGDEIVLRVTDDGDGLPVSGGRRSGLANVAQRAASLGGELVVESAPGAGTTILWTVPNR